MATASGVDPNRCARILSTPTKRSSTCPRPIQDSPPPDAHHRRLGGRAIALWQQTLALSRESGALDVPCGPVDGAWQLITTQLNHERIGLAALRSA